MRGEKVWVNEAKRTTGEALIEDNLPIARQVAARLKRRYGWLGIEELQSYALLGLSMAASRYESDRGVPFAKFACQKAMFGAIDEMRKDGLLTRRSSRLPRTVSLDEHARADSRGVEVADKHSADDARRLEARDLCASLLCSLKSRDRHLMLMYYGQGMTFREVAMVLDVSESMVCLRHKAILRKLRRLASSKGVA